MAITRPAFDHALEQLTGPATLVYYQQPTEGTTWHLLNQGKKFDPSSKVGSTTNKRLGDVSAAKTRGAAEHNLAIGVYLEDDIKEVAALLGYAIPDTGWDGSTAIRLDGSKKVNLKAVTFASTDTGAAELFTEYAMGFGVTELKPTLDADNDNARMAELTGDCDDYYFVPVA